MKKLVLGFILAMSTIVGTVPTANADANSNVKCWQLYEQLLKSQHSVGFQSGRLEVLYRLDNTYQPTSAEILEAEQNRLNILKNKFEVTCMDK